MHSEAEHIYILDWSGIPMTPMEKIAGFAAAVLYLGELYHGPMKFSRKAGQGVITGEGPLSWAGASGERFAIDWGEGRAVSFMLAAADQNTKIPEGFVKLTQLSRASGYAPARKATHRHESRAKH